MTWFTAWMDRRAGGAAKRYDSDMRRWEEAGFRDVRSRLAADLRGRILELGCGTGLNFAHYAADAQVEAIEPLEAFRNRAVERSRDVAARIRVQAGDAGDLPFADAFFDAALSTLVLCSVPDVPRALQELRRVLRPGASLRLLEHVRSEKRVVAGLQDVINPIWRWCDGHGCNLNRNTVQALRSAGFTLERVGEVGVRLPHAPRIPIREIYARRGVRPEQLRGGS